MRGSCLCGGVVFEADPPLRDVIICHCSQCRKQSGHVWAATSVPLDRFRMVEDRSLAWYRASPAATRGFCRDCGAFLFWKPEGEDRISFAAGALDGPTGLRVAGHYMPEDAGDYYSPEGPPPPAASPQSYVQRLYGSCLCGANRFSLPGPMGEVGACHCGQCRKLSGHYSASFDAVEEDIAWQARDIAEHATPGGSSRGYCPHCGSSIFFRSSGGFSIEAGVIDNPTGGRLLSHIFVADKGDYYVLDDGLPQFPGWDRP